MNGAVWLMDMDNAIEFISAYNEIDACLRARYKGKGMPGFSDLVRRCAETDGVIRRYEEVLMSYARLRNAIVHESTSERIIAEPCEETTREIKHIAALLSAPPTLKQCPGRKILGISSGATLRKAIDEMTRTDFSNLPVYRGGRIVGVLNNRRVVREIGAAIGKGEALDEVLSSSCGSVLSGEDFGKYYRVLSRGDTVQRAIDCFSENRKLLAVLVTTDGTAAGQLVNLLTPSDLPALWALLEQL